jgi:hypothetical protein
LYMSHCFIAHLNKCFLVLVILCEGLILFPFTSKGMNNIFIHESGPYQQGCFINLNLVR